MMQNIGVMENDLIDICTCSLPRANFIRFQPQSVDFLDITNPQAVLNQ